MIPVTMLQSLISSLIPFVADLLGNVEHNGDRQDMVLARNPNKLFAVFRANIGGVDNAQMSQSQTMVQDGVQQFKGFA